MSITSNEWFDWVEQEFDDDEIQAQINDEQDYLMAFGDELDALPF